MERIADIQHIKILTWLQGFMDKLQIIIFQNSIVLQLPERDSSTKTTKANYKYDKKALAESC